jgi:hypothetical protein
MSSHPASGTRCKDCGCPIAQVPEKALSGEVQIVWTSMFGWVCPVTGDEHAPGEPVTAVEAISAGIFAINTIMEPSASTAEDVASLEADADRLIHMLTKVREWAIAQGEDIEDRLAEEE